MSRGINLSPFCQTFALKFLFSLRIALAVGCTGYLKPPCMEKVRLSKNTVKNILLGCEVCGGSHSYGLKV